MATTCRGGATRPRRSHDHSIRLHARALQQRAVVPALHKALRGESARASLLLRVLPKPPRAEIATIYELPAVRCLVRAASRRACVLQKSLRASLPPIAPAHQGIPVHRSGVRTQDAEARQQMSETLSGAF